MTEISYCICDLCAQRIKKDTYAHGDIIVFYVRLANMDDEQRYHLCDECYRYALTEEVGSGTVRAKLAALVLQGRKWTDPSLHLEAAASVDATP